MSPEDFAKRMVKIAALDDTEGAHCDADNLMVDLLDDLGYGEGVATFRGMARWYA